MVQVVINPPRTPIGKINGVPIEITPEWYRFFVSIQKLLGGDSGGSDPFDDAILVATSAAVAAVEKNEDDFLSFHRTPGILTASGGLTGGGDMEGNISVSVGAGTGITVNADDVAIANTTVTAGSYGSASEVGTFTVNAQGQLTAAVNVAITAAAIGAVPTTRTLTAGAGLAGGGDLSADRTFDVGAGTGITVNANDVALDTSSTRNTDHASVTLIAGNGLTGGGDISANRSFAVGAGAGITVNADSIEVDTAVVVTLTGSQTLTNKTLTAPVISGGTIDNAVIGGTTPAAGHFTTLDTTGRVDIINGNIALVTGANSGGTTRTDATTKISRIASAHYTNAEEPIAIAVVSGTSTANAIDIGGGTGTLNAATQVRIFTAATTTTTTGTERVRIDGSGNVQMGGSNTVITSDRHHQLRSYTVATLPSAATAGHLIYVSDETGGAVPCFSDGANWRRVTDRAVAA